MARVDHGNKHAGELARRGLEPAAHRDQPGVRGHAEHRRADVVARDGGVALHPEIVALTDVQPHRAEVAGIVIDASFRIGGEQHARVREQLQAPPQEFVDLGATARHVAQRSADG